MAKIWVLQHHPSENLGGIADALEGAALAWQYARVFNQQPIPREMKGAGGLVILGGAESVYQLDRYPYLRDEIALIQNALAESKPVLAVCLGSQLLAAALGSQVRRGSQREIGWYPIRLNEASGDDRLMRGLPHEFTAMHWHSDVYDLPSGATALASSDLTRVQAFRYGANAYGIQFHAEMTREILMALVTEFSEGLKRVGIDGQAIVAQADAHLPKLEAIGAQIFSRWAAPIQGT
jgi:GMP synthase-like glutamine amidotransferase